MNAMNDVVQVANVPLSKPRELTAAGAVAAIDAWSDLSTSRQRDLKTAMAMLETITGVPLAAIPFKAKSVTDILKKASPAACNLKASSITAYRGWIRYTLTRLGLLSERIREAGELRHGWAPLVAELPDEMSWIRLRTLVRYLSARGVGPAAVRPNDGPDYLAHLQASDARGTARETARRAIASWNKAVGLIPGWPQIVLALPALETRQYSLPWRDYPESMQRDVATFEANLSKSIGESLFDEAGPPKPLRPAAVKTRMTGVRLCAAALVQRGIPLERITGLDVLVRFDNAKMIIDWHYQRAGRQVTDHLGVIADTLRVIARHHVRLPEAELKTLLPRLARAKPSKRRTMTPKNMRLLRELEDETRRACLLHLPEHLLRLARRMRDGRIERRPGKPDIIHAPRPYDAAWMACIATAVEIALHAPIRMENLANLRIGRHLSKLDSRRRRFTHLAIPGVEMKNGLPYEATLQPDTAKVLQEYIDDFRPSLPHHEANWLFPSKVTTENARVKSGLGKAISNAVHRHVGVRIHPHLFRALAGAFILEENPEAIDDVRQVLGHTTFETSMIYYRSWNPRKANERLGKLISRKRAETRLTAQAAFSSGRFGGARVPKQKRVVCGGHS